MKIPGVGTRCENHPRVNITNPYDCSQLRRLTLSDPRRVSICHLLPHGAPRRCSWQVAGPSERETEGGYTTPLRLDLTWDGIAHW